MPAQVPHATFLPLPPDLDLDKLVEETPNFQYVTRIPYDMIEAQGIDLFEKLVLLHVILGGKPLVIEGFQHCLPPELFSAAWLDEKHGSKFEKARNLIKLSDMDISISHYLKHMSQLTDQWNQQNYQDSSRQRLYLKDIDCPDEWHNYLRDLLPPNVFYLNESTVSGADTTGRKVSGSQSKRVAPAGDLMSSLPPPMRAENLMCYIGHEGTFTPAHREMCASLGQNIMVETSGDALSSWNHREKPGSSIWFMTETKDRFLVSEYWLSILGHDIEVEAHFAQINAWKHAPFNTFIVEQKVGDFILIPPLAPHQVWNRGTRTMKVAWNRTTVETLDMALNEALPRARMVCRDEQYKNKAIVYYTLSKYAKLLDRVDEHHNSGWSAAALAALKTDRKVRQLQKDFGRLFKLFTDILLSEMYSPDLPKEKHVQFLPFDSNVTCAYCRCNIFNRFLTCPTCINEMGEEDAYDVCMECYAMGRSCACISNLKWVEQFPWKKLVADYEDWRKRIIQMDGEINQDSPVALEIARRRLGKKTLAQVCQEQLKIRPWRDIKKRPLSRREEHGLEDEEQEETADDDDEDDKKRRRSRKRKRQSKKAGKNNINCHICKHRELDWKLARCSCGTTYCYGTLFRGFDMMPLEIMENPEWKCPRCLKICSCGQCRNNPEMRPYRPVGTLVGHDTKRVADPRSVESLVDFSRSNFNWIKQAEEGADELDQPYETPRLRRLREEAEREKAREVSLNEAFADDDEDVFRPANGFAQGSGSNYNRDSSPAIAVDPNLESFIDAVLEERGQTPPKSQHLAQNHLNDSDGLTALERDPQGFRSMAGLDNHSQTNGSDTPERPVAPVAKMVASPASKARTAVLRTGTSPSPQVPFSSREPRLRSLAQSALDADLEQTRAMRQKTLEKAKESNSYMMARARLDGLQKVASLPLPGAPQEPPDEGLRGPLGQTNQQLELDAEGAPVELSSSKDLVTSDLPPQKVPVRARTSTRKPPSKSIAPNPNPRPARRPRTRGGLSGEYSVTELVIPAEEATSNDTEDRTVVALLEDDTDVLPTNGHSKRAQRTLHPVSQPRAKRISSDGTLPTEVRNGPTRRKGRVTFSASDEKDDPSVGDHDNSGEFFTQVDDSYNPASKAPLSTKKNLSVRNGSTKKAAAYHDAKPIEFRLAESSESETSSASSESHAEIPPTRSAQGPSRRPLTSVLKPASIMPKSTPTKRKKRDMSEDSTTSTRSAPVAASGSLFSRPGMKGKKIKIVSEKNASLNSRGVQARKPLGR